MYKIEIMLKIMKMIHYTINKIDALHIYIHKLILMSFNKM